MTTTPETKTKPRKTKRQFYGRVPHGRYSVLDFDHPQWLLFGQRQHPSGWQNLKLVHRGTHSKRANYWVSWSAIERRFANCADQPELERNEPELLGELIAYLSGRTLEPPQRAPTEGRGCTRTP
jgi:hypothetical protein